ncbi:MAG: hypothetical protein IKN57_02125 [Parasporobacterium sp.]|nr:hypothetical protein [Parasporobacterium sp.]MBR3642283.1 hypothetical protein [Parasporobacterium sp.]
MLKKKLQIIFIVLFYLMIAVPLAAMFFQHEIMDIEENRRLAEPARLTVLQGGLNRDFPAEFERWLNDHIGFRKQMIQLHGQFHYYVYHVFPKEQPYMLGRAEALNYETGEMLLDYQHRNLYTEAYLKEAAESLQKIKDYAEAKNIDFYYFQCWDKHSIYPEHMPEEILQYGGNSKTDEILRALEEYTDIPVISPKAELLSAKKSCAPYSFWGDPTHWTERGSFIGYQVLMNRINQDRSKAFPVLTEADYKIRLKDDGLIRYGIIHKESIEEHFQLRDPKAELTSEKLSSYAGEPRCFYYTNKAVNNDTRVLIIGDSYIHDFNLPSIAESFQETVFIHGSHMPDFQNLVETFDPDLIIIENAEREDRTGLWILTASAGLKQNN